MGTNYYLHQNVCEVCGRGDEPRHIGKSSSGWCFALRVYPDDGINDLPDWIPLFMSGTILDEYLDNISFEEMMTRITQRVCDAQYPQSGPFGYNSEEEFLAENHAIRGPNGLARQILDGRHCTGHGEGTWDLMLGEFS
jgi:hypothetical protein